MNGREVTPPEEVAQYCCTNTLRKCRSGIP